MAELPKLTSPAPEVERRIHKGLDKFREIKNAEYKENPRLAFSQIGKCERGLWASVNGIPKDSEPEGRILVLFDLGDAVEEHLVRLLRRGEYLVEDKDPALVAAGADNCQWRVVDFDGKASGRVDGKIHIGSSNPHWALLELKSSNVRKFNLLEELNSYEKWNSDYADQIQIYMGLLKLPETLVGVECKDDSRLYWERIKFDPTRFQHLRQKAGRIVTSEEILDRPEKATSQYCKFCKYCDYNEWCWDAATNVSFDA